MAYRYYLAIIGSVPVRYRAGASSTSHTHSSIPVSCLTKDGIIYTCNPVVPRISSVVRDPDTGIVTSSIDPLVPPHLYLRIILGTCFPLLFGFKVKKSQHSMILGSGEDSTK